MDRIAQQAGRMTHGVTSLNVEARTVVEIPAAFDAALQWHAEALIVSADSVQLLGAA